MKASHCPLHTAALVALAVLLSLPAQAQITLDLEWTRLGDSQGVLGQERGVASVESAEFSHDGTLIVSGAKRGGDVVLWTAAGQELWRRYHAGRAEIEVVAFTKDDRHVVSGGEDGFVRVWRVSDGAEVQAFTLGNTSGSQVSFDGMRFSPDGTRLATGDERGQLSLWNTSDPNPANWPATPVVTVVHGPDGDRAGGGSGNSDINSIDWTSDGVFLVTGSRDATVKRWRVDQLAPPQNGLVQTYTGFLNSIKSTRLSPDGALVAAGGQDSPEGLVLVWDVASGDVVRRIDYTTNRKIEAVEWTPNGRFLLTGGVEGRDEPPYPFNGGVGPIRAYDREAGFALVLEEPTFRQEYFHFDSDGDRLVTSSEDGGLRLWNVSYAGEPTGQVPFGGVAAAVPGRLEAERFDEGGLGIAFQEEDAANQGGASLRAGGVDVFASGAASGGFAIGWIDDGEWLEFTVEVAEAGTYAVSARVATPQSGRDFRVEAGAASAAVAVPNTGGWTDWQTVAGSPLELSAGRQVVRIALTDGPFNLDWIELTQTGTPPVAVTTESQVGGSADDAEQLLGTGAVQLGSVDLDMASTGVPQVAGMRFALDVPRQAVVTSAYVQFTAKEASSGPASLSVRAQASDDAAAFAPGAGDLTSRPRTSSAVAWSPGGWTGGASGAAQRTPDLSALVQAVVERGGWQAGQHLVLLVDGSGKRSGWSFDGNPNQAPRLVVTYQAPAAAPAGVPGDAMAKAQPAGVVRVEGVYPNPVADAATVRYVLDEPADVDLRVFDTLGREVATLASGARQAGAHRASLEATRLPAGLYLVRLSTEAETVTYRITVVR